MYRLGFLVLLLVVVSISCGQVAMANPASAPSSFGQFPTYGLTMLPAVFEADELTYTLSLSSDAYIEYGGVHFPITQVWAFFAINRTGLDANDMIASGPNYGDWAWDQRPNQGSHLNVAGWMNASKSQAILAPASGSVSKQFTFSQFSFSGAAPTVGYHISISVPQGATSPFASGGVTSNIVPQTVPEPASGLMLLTGVLGLGSLVSRRRPGK